MESKRPDHKFNSLRLENLTFQVKLGCTAEERAVRQEVRITLEMRFDTAPPGVTSDELDGTICYAEVASLLLSHCESSEFKLIERLGYECYVILKDLFGDKVEIGVNAHKVRPPVDSLKGGAIYRCGDFWA
jgi:FolB domain-containing protein